MVLGSLAQLVSGLVLFLWRNHRPAKHRLYPHQLWKWCWEPSTFCDRFVIETERNSTLFESLERTHIGGSHGRC